MKLHILKFATIALCIACLVTLGAKSMAQDLGSLGKQAGALGAASDIAQQLHLTPSQLQKVLPILQKEMPKLQAIKGSSTLSDSQKETQAKAVQQQSDSKLKPLLSPEQFSSLQNFRVQQLQDLLHGTTPH